MLEGHLLDGRYQIKRTIGGGGMANVYLAYDLILDREVAVKVLRLEYTHDAEFIARFEREVQSATSLAHPNIVNIYDVGEESHILYMVMEYVDGMTLKEYIFKNHPVSVETAMQIMKQILSAIATAHNNELIHRDIKPQNILIDSSGQVKVTDFGIAIALSATSLTQTNSIMGSVHYLSPEQARGETATKQSDIYALGILLFELLTGQLPFDGQSPVSIAIKHLQYDTPSIQEFNPEVSQGVENIVLKATAKNPIHRFQTIAEMENAIERVLDPNYKEEAKYIPPTDDEESTKAIPILTDDLVSGTQSEDTIIHKTKDSNPEKKPKKKPKKKRKKRWLLWFIPLILILIGVTIYFAPKLFGPQDRTVPDLINKEYEDVVDVLEGQDLRTERAYTYSDEIDEGYVAKTSPKAGKVIKEDSVVTVYVSQGKEKITMDDYADKDFDNVEKELLEKGFNNVIPYEKYSNEPKGEILKQIQPTPGNEVVPSETTVIMEISAGPEMISLNNLKGMTEEEVKAYLNKYGLVYQRHEESSDDVPKGEVIKQDPERDTELVKGEVVNVYISTGPKKDKTVKKSETFTVPYQPQDKDDKEKQKVKIYVEDEEHDIDDVYKETKINKDKEFTIKFKLKSDKEGTYKVTRDDEEIINKTVEAE